MIVADPVLEQPVLAAAPASARMAGAGRLALDYLSLLKPRIGLLLVSTELGAMVVAARGWPGAGLTLAALGGGALAAGGASAINCWFDRDIDAAMSRTRHRPIPAGRIPSWHALAIGVAMNMLAFVVLAVVYFVTPANQLPSVFPGHTAHATRHHTKHGLAAFAVAVVALIGAWFTTAPARTTA